MNPRRIRARSWCRVDLAGGTLDIWPLGLLHEGAATVNLAIDLEAQAEIRLRESGYRVRQGDSVHEFSSLDALRADADTALVGVVVAALDLPPVEIELRSGSPRGGGLGASSALAIALIAAGETLVKGSVSAPEAQVALARDLEARLMSLPTGVQDHYPGLLGGALEISYHPGGERVRSLEVDLSGLGSHLLVAYSGRSHFSAGANWQVIRRRLEGDAETAALFAGIAGVAARMPQALEAGDWAEAGRLLSEEWACRRRLSSAVSTPALEAMLRAGREAGAWGGKACGAGGGGSMAFLCPPERRSTVVSSLEALGAEILDAAPTAEPLEVASLDD